MSNVMKRVVVGVCAFTIISAAVDSLAGGAGKSKVSLAAGRRAPKTVGNLLRRGCSHSELVRPVTIRPLASAACKDAAHRCDVALFRLASTLFLQVYARLDEATKVKAQRCLSSFSDFLICVRAEGRGNPEIFSTGADGCEARVLTHDKSERLLKAERAAMEAFSDIFMIGEDAMVDINDTDVEFASAAIGGVICGTLKSC